MDNTTLAIILTFVLLILALILLPAASFIQLVGLIRSNGSKVEAVHQAVQQVQTTLSNGAANGTSSSQETGMHTTPAGQAGPSIESTETKKSQNDS